MTSLTKICTVKEVRSSMPGSESISEGVISPHPFGRILKSLFNTVRNMELHIYHRKNKTCFNIKWCSIKTFNLIIKEEICKLYLQVLT